MARIMLEIRQVVLIIGLSPKGQVLPVSRRYQGVRSGPGNVRSCWLPCCSVSDALKINRQEETGTDLRFGLSL
jgi:hypothetical protein